MITMKHIRENLFELNQADFGEAIGVDQSTVSRWERGAEPKIWQVRKIVSAAKDREIDLTAESLMEMYDAPQDKVIQA